MKNYADLLLAFILLALVAGSIWWSIAAYNECRATGGSWMYCLKVAGK